MDTATERIIYNRTELYPKQEAALFDPRRYSLTEATTKSGKTSGCVIWLGEKALAGKPGENFLWVAPVYDQARMAFDRMCESTTREIIRPNINEMRIDYAPVGTHAWFKSADHPDSLYGYEFKAAVIDEASRMKEASWHAVRSTLTATRGQVRLIGNVRGRRNWFYRMCRKAEAGDRDMGYHKLTWRDAVEAGILELSEIEDARSQLPPSVFQELFEAQASDDQGNPFGTDAIRSCIIEAQSRFPIACWGWDLAKHHDWTYGVALDRQGREVRTVRFQAPWRDTRKRIILETQGRPALVDATGVGDPIVEDLQASPGGNFEGFVFTSRTKQMLMENLAIAFQQRDIGLTDRVLIAECESFEYVFTATGIRYSAPDGMYDDGVCALALAKKKLGNHGTPFQSARVRRDGAIIPGGGDEGPGSPGGYDDTVRVGRDWTERELTL